MKKVYKDVFHFFTIEDGSSNLKDIEHDLFWDVVSHTKKYMHKIPWFILSVLVLNELNIQAGQILLNKVFFESPFKDKYVSVDPDRYEYIVVASANMVVINRGWLMRLQWILQILAISIAVGVGLKLT